MSEHFAHKPCIGWHTSKLDAPAPSPQTHEQEQRDV